MNNAAFAQMRYIIFPWNRYSFLTDGVGIGLMIAQALEANGAIVYIIGRRKESLEKAAATAVCDIVHFLI